jgi:N-acetylglucosamine kinase-like BadF-type ATPase
VVGFDQASKNVQTAIQQAFESAGMARCQVSSICLAMAGSDRPAERSQWHSWAVAQQIASQQVVVTNDAIPVIFAANPSGQGVALIAGTGSLALGRTTDGNTDGTIARSGGWGPLIGDEGSGYAIAIAGLRDAAKAADGRGEATDLLPRFCQSLEADTPSQIISALYSDAYDRPRIASLASIVFDASADGDAVASAIIGQATRDLALMVRAVVTRLKMDPNESVLAITGGVALNQPTFVDQITTHLRDNSIFFNRKSLERYPVTGAIQMAVNALT